MAVDDKKITHIPEGFQIYGNFVIAFLKDGVLHENVSAVAVEIGAESDLSTLTGLVEPGSIAFTAGAKNAWQLGVDGETWEPMFTEG